MGVAALVLAIIALVFAVAPPLIPYQIFQNFGQIIGTTLGLIALVIGVLGRKQAAANDQPRRAATAGIALGGVSAILGLVVFFSCLYCWQLVGQEMERGGGRFKNKFRQAFFKEFGREMNSEGKPEFRKALERAVKHGTKARLKPPAPKKPAPNKPAKKK